MLEGTTTTLSLSLSSFFPPRFHVLINATTTRQVSKSLFCKSRHASPTCAWAHIVDDSGGGRPREGGKRRSEGRRRRRKSGGWGEYGHTGLRIVDAFNEVSTRRSRWKRLRGLEESSRGRKVVELVIARNGPCLARPWEGKRERHLGRVERGKDEIRFQTYNKKKVIVSV